LCQIEAATEESTAGVGHVILATASGVTQVGGVADGTPALTSHASHRISSTATSSSADHHQSNTQSASSSSSSLSLSSSELAATNDGR